MLVSEAKDFLVRQAAEQAQLDGVSLFDLEKRMMHFTEGPDATEDPYTLNSDFEAEYDTDEYEAKISKLLHRAHSRVKKENPDTSRQWSEAVKVLKQGDHYILVML